MRKLIIASALAATAFTTPAIARDGSAYVGVEGGVMLVEDFHFDYSDSLTDIEDAYIIDNGSGFDVDLIGGYDFGMFRIEGELGYKRASVDEARIDAAIGGSADPADSILAANGHHSALSAMVNGLLDFGDDGRLSGYLGGGIGFARVSHDFDINGIDRFLDASDTGLAYQAIAGIRAAVSENIDVGIKYRYFTVPGLTYDVDGPLPFEARSKWKSHSLLLSLVYNFAAPPAPPPPPPPIAPPPPPPATQTCPDGTVILATEVCPAPPPPPPPPPPAPERG